MARIRKALAIINKGITNQSNVDEEGEGGGGEEGLERPKRIS